MALSEKFRSLRHRGGDASIVIDPDFLREKIYVPTTAMAPRHSWGGAATTQTKIDVKDEEIEAIKGNLAYRFKAAKSIYAKVEDSALEPLARDESFSGRVQLNKTAAFNVEKLLAYNKNPVPMDEMGMKLYYKHDEFLRRKIRKRKNNRLSMLAAEEAGALVAKNALESAPSLRKRSIEALVDNSTSTSAAELQKISSRISSKSCLPQVKSAAAVVDSARALVSPSAKYERNSSLSDDLASVSGFRRDEDRATVVPVHLSRSTSSTESAASSKTESAASSQMFEETLPDTSIRRSSPPIPSVSRDPVSKAPTSFIGSSNFSTPTSSDGVATPFPPISSMDAATPLAPPFSVQTSNLSRNFVEANENPPYDCTQNLDLTLSNSTLDPLNTTSRKKSKKSKETKPKEIPAMPVAGYARTDPRTYDCAKGIHVSSDLLVLDSKKLVNNWVKYESKQRKKSSSVSDEDIDMGIGLSNWRDLVQYVKEYAGLLPTEKTNEKD